MAEASGHSSSRRAWLSGLWVLLWAGLVGALGLFIGAALRLAGGGSTEALPAPVDLGPSAGLSPGQVRVKGGVALCRDQGGLYALLLICPHLGCRPAWHSARGRFLCPCHGSAFALDGSRLAGPATRGLSHLALEQRGQRLWARPGSRVAPARRLKVRQS